jgi:hypothetical protein
LHVQRRGGRRRDHQIPTAPRKISFGGQCGVATKEET